MPVLLTRVSMNDNLFMCVEYKKTGFVCQDNLRKRKERDDGLHSGKRRVDMLLPVRSMVQKHILCLCRTHKKTSTSVDV